MPDPTPAQVEAAARALRHAWFPGLMDQPATEEWLRRARAALTAAAQVPCAHTDQMVTVDGLRCVTCFEAVPPQPAPEAPNE